MAKNRPKPNLKTAADLGTVYFFDENGGSMKGYVEVLYR